MLTQIKPVRVRLHLVSGEVIECGIDEAGFSPALGSGAKQPDGTIVPVVPAMSVVHLKGESTQRRIFGATIEIIEEESLIVEPSPRGLVT